MFQRYSRYLFLLVILLTANACQKNVFDKQAVAPSSLRDVPALKLNYRFEADVPAPPAVPAQNNPEEKNNAVQADFDQNRAQEILERTIASPDKKRFLAVYRKAEDKADDFRLDMYAADGKLLRTITPGGLAVHFPDTIVWSPDNTNVAFVGIIRAGLAAATPETAPTPPEVDTNTNTVANSSENTNVNTNTNTNVNVSKSSNEPPKSVLTFRTEQIYICNADGGDLKLLTQNEGLKYFYFVWSPDGAALAALAATWKEWQYTQAQADKNSEIFVPAGRPRLIEKTGRIRLLDDNITPVQPVWSPDSSKVALGFDKEIRIYDAIGDTPTQAAILLRNGLLISSKKYDDDLKRKDQSEAANTNANTNVNTNTNVNANLNTNTVANQDVSTLPDESTLISYNPIVQLEWTEDKMLYLQTGFIREYKNASENRHTNLRWHRLMFSPQAVKIN